MQHGVPKSKNPTRVGCRFSIIAWGTRRSINKRNAGSKENEVMHSSSYQVKAREILSDKGEEGNSSKDALATDIKKEQVTNSKEVLDLVEKLIQLETEKQTRRESRKTSTKNLGRKTRVQGLSLRSESKLRKKKLNGEQHRGGVVRQGRRGSATGSKNPRQRKAKQGSKSMSDDGWK
mmetsp:Transcript_4961/g.6552  ORF Transcript_4961/g.6552 Transcript_4961/m.6552 type:complete len:177 (+) Transcript_4961:53-583(+)